MQGIKRKIVYVSLYEIIAVTVCSIIFVVLSDASIFSAGALSIATSVVAVIWNFIFTTMFEYWEAQQASRHRSTRRRIVHAVTFEAGLIAMLVPLIAWWLDVSMGHAFGMNIGMAIFFMCYTFVFSWSFDRVFGLPLSARNAS